LHPYELNLKINLDIGSIEQELYVHFGPLDYDRKRTCTILESKLYSWLKELTYDQNEQGSRELWQ